MSRISVTADDPVVVALRVARPEIQRAVDAIEARLARAGKRLSYAITGSACDSR